MPRAGLTTGNAAAAAASLSGQADPSDLTTRILDRIADIADVRGVTGPRRAIEIQA